MGVTHGPTEGRGQELGRNYLLEISSFPPAVPLADVLKPSTLPGVRFSAPGDHFSAPTLSKLPRNTLAAKSILRTSPCFREKEIPALTTKRGRMMSTTSSNEREPRRLSSTSIVFSPHSAGMISRARSCDLQSPFDPPSAGMNSRSASDSFVASPEPMDVLMRHSSDAWKVMGCRFQKAVGLAPVPRSPSWEPPPPNTVTADRRAVLMEMVRATVRRERGILAC